MSSPAHGYASFRVAPHSLRFIRYLHSLLQDSFHLFNPLFQRFQHLQVVIQCLSSSVASMAVSSFLLFAIAFTYEFKSLKKVFILYSRMLNCSHYRFVYMHPFLAKRPGFLRPVLKIACMLPVMLYPVYSLS